MRNLARRKKWWKMYTQSPKRKAWKKAYAKTKRYKEGRKKYRASLRGRLATRRANESAKIRRVNKARKLKKYGLTLSQFDWLLVRQAGRCGICIRPMRTPQVDHCHRRNRVRGLLCNPCNRALGLFGDNAVVVQSAVEYLREAERAIT